MAEDVPENHVVSEDVGMLTGVTELAALFETAMFKLENQSCLCPAM